MGGPVDCRKFRAVPWTVGNFERSRGLRGPKRGRSRGLPENLGRSRGLPKNLGESRGLPKNFGKSRGLRADRKWSRGRTANFFASGPVDCSLPFRQWLICEILFASSYETADRGETAQPRRQALYAASRSHPQYTRIPYEYDSEHTPLPRLPSLPPLGPPPPGRLEPRRRSRASRSASTLCDPLPPKHPSPCF